MIGVRAKAGATRPSNLALEKIALRALAQNPSPVVRLRLLRDVLRRPRGEVEVEQARANLDASRCVRELESEQRADGGWGAFHSRSATRRQKIPSTEVGVERALALGLDASHPILRNARAHIVGIMQGAREFPDYQEKNDRWQTGMRLFLASTLSLIQPDHPILNEDRKLWGEIARRTFQSGRYRAQDEIAAHAALTGATVQNSYLVINGRYQLILLGAIPGTLSREIERALLDWVWKNPNGIGYLEMPLHDPPPQKPGQCDRWLASLEILARGFPGWAEWAQPAIQWLWQHRDARGYWDFGARSRASADLPLSDSWRAKQNRAFDWATRVLILLKKFYADQNATARRTASARETSS